MKVLRTLLLSMVCTIAAASPNTNDSLEDQALDFFEQYIGLYNHRLGHPERSDWFQTEMAKLIHAPILNVPLNGAPRATATSSEYASNLDTFIAQLESRGVSRLQYLNIQVHALTPNKVIANNLAHGFNNAGDVLFETISIYLLYQNGEQWQIAMLNAYDVANALDF